MALLNGPIDLLLMYNGALVLWGSKNPIIYADFTVDSYLKLSESFRQISKESHMCVKSQQFAVRLFYGIHYELA